MKLPGITKPVTASQSIYLGSSFTWGEALHNLTRIPQEEQIVANIIKVARVMDEVRKLLGGKPITVTSWYRPQMVNNAVGGAKDSQHLYGNAVDFLHADLSPFEVFGKLDDWYGNRGGLSSSRTFTHIDTRGYRARNFYGTGR